MFDMPASTLPSSIAHINYTQHMYKPLPSSIAQHHRQLAILSYPAFLRCNAAMLRCMNRSRCLLNRSQRIGMSTS